MVSSLPKAYRLSTTRNEQQLHARLLRKLRSKAVPVLTSWVRTTTADGERLLQLHLVFRDRPGSLGLVSNVLSSSGANITGVSAYTTADGFAIDTIGLHHMIEDARLPALDEKIIAAFSDAVDMSSSTAVTSNSALSNSSLAALHNNKAARHVKTDTPASNVGFGAQSLGQSTMAANAAMATPLPAGQLTGLLPVPVAGMAQPIQPVGALATPVGAPSSAALASFNPVIGAGACGNLLDGSSALETTG